MGFHLSWVFNPPHEIVGSIRELAGDVIALANTIEGRADKTLSPGYTRNFVAGIAAVPANFCST
jgi:hypothetical protein